RADLRRLKRDTTSSRSAFTSAMQVAEGLPVTAKKSQWALWAGLAIVILIIVGLGGAWFYFSRNSKIAQQDINVVPFTSSPGQQLYPVFSPHCKQLAYNCIGEVAYY